MRRFTRPARPGKAFLRRLNYLCTVRTNLLKGYPDIFYVDTELDYYIDAALEVSYGDYLV